MRLGPLALIVLLAAGCSDDRTTGPAQPVGTAILDQRSGIVGGLSGIDIGPDGQEVTLLLDRGALIRGLLIRDEEGRPTGIRRWHLVPIIGPPDAILGPHGLDTEGLAVGEAGIFVSVERSQEVWRLSPEGELAERLPQHPDFLRLPGNASLEALAIDAEGALYTLPERTGWLRRPFPVWRYADGAWARVFEVPRRGQYLPVGADFGPDGRLYLLERRMPVPLRFASRIRAFDIAEGRIAGEETLLETPLGLHDNLEGIAVWRDAEGAIRLTMVSDDNYSSLQEMQIVEYRLPLAEQAARQ